MALRRLHNLEGKLGIPLYPIIGVGSVPFRGHLNPVNVNRAFTEYPSVQTLTVQSAFKYDYDKETVRDGIAQILAHERAEPMPVDYERARELIRKTTTEYQNQVQKMIQIISAVSSHIPKRRERKLHVGLFGYGRSLDGVGRSDSAASYRLHRFAILHWRSAGAAGPGCADRCRPRLCAGGLPQPGRRHQRGPSLHK